MAKPQTPREIIIERRTEIERLGGEIETAMADYQMAINHGEDVGSLASYIAACLTPAKSWA
jgi:hypothetical protein